MICAQFQVVCLQHLLDAERGGRRPGRSRDRRLRVAWPVRRRLLVVHRQVSDKITTQELEWLQRPARYAKYLKDDQVQICSRLQGMKLHLEKV